MAIVIKQGNLIAAAENGDIDVLVHGCNCFCVMGAGIARAIKEQYPNAYYIDQQTARGDVNKLGTINGVFYTTSLGNTLAIVNAYTQFSFGHDQVHADYTAIRNCMMEIKKKFSGRRIGLPMIGCGLAGGDWNIVSVIIDEELGDEDVTIMYL